MPFLFDEKLIETLLWLRNNKQEGMYADGNNMKIEKIMQNP